MQQKVFISYSSKDAKIAQTICEALEARGHGCWMASRNVRPGENYQGAIVRAIGEAGVMVMVFSTNANNSDEIKKELALASQSKLNVIPVRSEDVLPSEDFRYELATRQWIDLFHDWERAMEQLCQQIDSAIPRSAEPAPAVAQGPKTKSRMPIYAGLVAALLLAAAGAAWLLRPAAAPPPPVVAAKEAAPAPAPAMDPVKLENNLWDAVKDTGDTAALQSYLAKYPGGMFAAAAKAKIAALNKPATQPAPVKTAAKPAAAPQTSAPQAVASQVVTPAAKPIAPASSNSVSAGLNSDVQKAVAMARAVETRARAMAERARQAQGTSGAETAPVRRFARRLAAIQNAGPAVITYGNGDVYAGGTRGGQRYGAGVFTGTSSTIFRERVGEFVADQMSGYGVVYRNDGRVRIGQWKGGGMEGYGAVYDAGGRVVEQGIYADDKLVTPLTGN
jgi:hypothetical protein